MNIEIINDFRSEFLIEAREQVETEAWEQFVKSEFEEFKTSYNLQEYGPFNEAWNTWLRNAKDQNWDEYLNNEIATYEENNWDHYLEAATQTTMS